MPNYQLTARPPFVYHGSFSQGFAPVMFDLSVAGTGFTLAKTLALKPV